ncbi:MAG TPA: hypothetical protein GX717_09250 [Clostridiaceae bacterium]|nr:hypothetical protein [Clostridiaceae bacterium]
MHSLFYHDHQSTPDRGMPLQTWNPVVKDKLLPQLSFAERQAFGPQIVKRGQATVMKESGLFAFPVTVPPPRTNIPPPGSRQKGPRFGKRMTSDLTAVVFNVERGQTLPELLAYVSCHPLFAAADIVFANELDDGCERSGNQDVSGALACALNCYEVYGIEFVELVNSRDRKGYHGNSLFSRWPILKADVFYLPEEYNWYYDAKQKRLGGRLAVFAVIDAPGGEIGAVSVHFENRTDATGRLSQMDALLNQMESFFPPNMPIILGGDFNTNGYDGRDYTAVERMLKRQKAGASPASYIRDEMIFSLAEDFGYTWQDACELDWPTRRAHFSEEIYDENRRDTLFLHLDWLFSRRLRTRAFGMISTILTDIKQEIYHPLIESSKQNELSDHNLVWATYRL